MCGLFGKSKHPDSSPVKSLTHPRTVYRICPLRAGRGARNCGPSQGEAEAWHSPLRAQVHPEECGHMRCRDRPPDTSREKDCVLSCLWSERLLPV